MNYVYHYLGGVFLLCEKHITSGVCGRFILKKSCPHPKNLETPPNHDHFPCALLMSLCHVKSL